MSKDLTRGHFPSMPARGDGSSWEGEDDIQKFLPRKRKFCLCLFIWKNLSYSYFFPALVVEED